MVRWKSRDFLLKRFNLSCVRPVTRTGGGCLLTLEGRLVIQPATHSNCRVKRLYPTRKVGRWAVAQPVPPPGKTLEDKMTTIVTNMVTIYCYKCGIAFCVTKDFNEKRLENRNKEFWCPAGHGQVYTGKSDLDKIKEQLRRSELETEQAERELKATRRSRTALRGQITKTKNRISKGVCPCCNRQFTNMQRHMETKHPDYAEEKKING